MGLHFHRRPGGGIVDSNKCGSRGFNPPISLNVGGSRIFPFGFGNKNPFARNPVSFRDLPDTYCVPSTDGTPRWGPKMN